MSDTMRMSIKQFSSFLQSVVEHNKHVGETTNDVDDYVATLCVASPGTAKTSVHNQVSKKCGVGVLSFNASTADPVDLNGIPDILDMDGVGKVTDWIKPEMFRKPDNTMFLFDEATKAQTPMLNAMSMLINERRAGMHDLPRGSTVSLVGNNISDNAGDNPLPTHVSNRLCHVKTYMTHDHFLEYAAEAGLDPRITGFVRQYGSSAFSFDANLQVNPTYRSMARVNNLLKMNLTHETLVTAVAGYIGESSASKFKTYLQYESELDSPQSIIADPENARIPSGNNMTGMMYAVASGLIGHANRKTIGKIMTYLNRLPSKEIVVFAVKDIMLRYPELKRDPSLNKWQLDNQRLFSVVV